MAVEELSRLLASSAPQHLRLRPLGDSTAATAAMVVVHHRPGSSTVAWPHHCNSTEVEDPNNNTRVEEECRSNMVWGVGASSTVEIRPNMGDHPRCSSTGEVGAHPHTVGNPRVSSTAAAAVEALRTSHSCHRLRHCSNMMWSPRVCSTPRDTASRSSCSRAGDSGTMANSMVVEGSTVVVSSTAAMEEGLLLHLLLSTRTPMASTVDSTAEELAGPQLHPHPHRSSNSSSMAALGDPNGPLMS